MFLIQCFSCLPSYFLNFLIKGLITLTLLSVCASVLEALFDIWLAANLPDNLLILLLKDQVTSQHLRPTVTLEIGKPNWGILVILEFSLSSIDIFSSTKRIDLFMT